MSIGENIKRRRTFLDLTLEDVAKRVGISRQTMSRYETGVIGNIPSDKIEAIAEALHCSPAYLMGWEDGNETFGPTESWVDVYTLVSHMPEDEQEALGKRVLAIVRDTPPDAIVDPAVAEIILQLRSAPAAKRRAALAAALAVLKSE